jgi:hypothetical protein
VPHLRRTVSRDNLHAKQTMCQLKQTLQDGGQWEIRPQFLFGVLVLRLSQPLRPERNVPQLQRFRHPLRLRKGAHFFQIALRRGIGLRAQHFNQLHHTVDGVRHLRVQRLLGETRIPQQLGQLRFQRQNATNQDGVVVVSRRRTADVRAVDLFANVAVAEVLHHRQIRGDVQRNHPGPRLGRRLGITLSFRILRGHRLGRSR